MSLTNFEILSEIGAGAYSNVFKVRRLADQQIYALKKVKMHKLNKTEKNNALNEIRILASIHHPNIISYKEAFFEESGNLCLVMEYADSGDLFQKIVKHQKRSALISEHFIWNAFTQVTQGLRVLHELRVLHRDMKSANIFLNRDGTVKLGDMNVSKETKNGLLYTQTGTPYYASPEVWQDKPYNTKSDIWSLGCVLYEACTLKPPFRAEDMQGLYDKVIQGDFSPISSNYSKDLSWIIKKLLQVDPNKRPNCDQILRVPAVMRRMKQINDNIGNCELIEEIKLQEQDSIASDLPIPDYSCRHKSEMPSINKSPSKLIKNERNRSFAIRNHEIRYKHYGEVSKESFKLLPRGKYAAQSPLPLRKLKELEEHLSLPKSLPAYDRLKQLRNAYLGHPYKLYIN